MSIHKHTLKGCSPEPLAHYLKALGILRLVSEQKDPGCRGAWRDDQFVLVTKLEKEELEQFFLNEYEPTAMVSPWNKGSGFYQAKDPALSPLEASTASRFFKFKAGIVAARALLDEMVVADKQVRDIKGEAKLIKNAKEREAFKKTDAYKARLAEAERKFKNLKADMIPNCRLHWRGSHQEWMSTAMVLDERGEPEFPALMGTGGNDGRLDFTNNFMQRLIDLFDTASDKGIPNFGAQTWLRHAFWGNASNGHISGAAVGQYLPGAAGGANSTTGSIGDSLVNPWDFILMMEGAILFASAATKRMGPLAHVQASAPFALRSHALGMGTVSGAEESQRGEQWMPLWNRFLALPELIALLGEGRAQIGKSTASRPVEMARAIARLGVARGISSFQRFGYLERNGQANFAVPLGRITVQEHAKSRLIDDLAPWMERLHRAARDKGAPARLAHAERRLADAVFAALTHDDSPSRWQAILRAAVAVEQLQAASTGFSIGPIPHLSPEWIAACLGPQPGAEERLALALGSAATGYSREGKPFDSVRHHWLPLKDGARQFKTSDKRLANDVRVVAYGRDPEADLLALLDRRAIEAEQAASRHPRLIAARGAGARLADISAWIAGEVDMNRCLELARAFMAVEWRNWNAHKHAIPWNPSNEWPEDAWCALRLNALPWALRGDLDIPFDPAILRRLAVGDGPGALNIALRRLKAHGICIALRSVICDPPTARRWASALAFPVAPSTAQNLLERIQPTSKENRHDR